MRITINQNDAVVGVDGVFRAVDVSELAGEIRAVQFDTDAGEGHIEFDRGVTREIDVRDFDAEAAAEAEAGDDREKQAALKPIFKKRRVQRAPEPIADFGPFQVYLDRWVAAAPPPPTPEQLERALQKQLTDAVQLHMDAQAQAIGYDNIFTAVTYADEPEVAKFQAEGLAFRAWRSRVWARCYELLDQVKAGTRPVPTAEQLIAELPALVLP